MTVIAGVKHKGHILFASDSMLTSDGFIFHGGPKFRTYGDHVLGLAGDSCEWPEASDMPDELVTMTKGEPIVALLAGPGTFSLFNNGEEFVVSDNFVAIGTGAACAMGVLNYVYPRLEKLSLPKAVCVITEAMELAVEVADGCGGAIHTMLVKL